jgi:hypothetical protein
MRSFKEYLTESVKKYDFRIKVAQECTTEREAKMKGLLERFGVADFNKKGKTPIQQLPLDFPKIRNTEVSIYEVTLNYPTTSNELHKYLTTGLEMHESYMVVRSPSEPSEEYQEPVEKRTEALLTDPTYKEAPNSNFDDFYGEKYNNSFLKQLNADAAERRKQRGEQIPTSGQ